MHLFSLKVYTLWTNKLADFCCLLFYPALDLFLQKKRLLCANRSFFYIFNEGMPLWLPLGVQTSWTANNWLCPMNIVILRTILGVSIPGRDAHIVEQAASLAAENLMLHHFSKASPSGFWLQYCTVERDSGYNTPITWFNPVPPPPPEGCATFGICFSSNTSHFSTSYFQLFSKGKSRYSTEKACCIYTVKSDYGFRTNGNNINKK